MLRKTYDILHITLAKHYEQFHILQVWSTHGAVIPSMTPEMVTAGKNLLRWAESHSQA